MLLLDHFDTHLDYFLEDVGMILWTIFLSLFGPLLGTILGPIFGPDRPKRGQDEPKRAIRRFKEPKSCIFKKVVFAGTVCIFSLLRPPKEFLNPKKKGSNIDPKINKFWTNFGVQNGFQKYPPKLLQEEPKN